MTTAFIDLMCWVGLADGRKRASREAIESRKKRTGDGTWKFEGKGSDVEPTSPIVVDASKTRE